MKIYTIEELKEYILLNRIQRSLNSIHVHYTEEPSYKDFTGINHEELQVNMTKYHVEKKGWSDYAYHLTSYPDGLWTIGRSFERSPASIRGFNYGAFAFAMVGCFDEGKDKITGVQYASAINLCDLFNDLYNTNIIFHREKNKNKTCPGNSIIKSVFLNDVKNWKI